MAQFSDDPLSAPLPELPAMDPAQKALRDTFVAEYLIDYHQVAAAMRCGFSRNYAVEWAARFMEEAYVQQRIKSIEMTPVDPEKEKEFNRQRIIQQLLREAYYKGPGSSHAARVAALRELKTVYGLDATKKVEATINHRGGVMRVPGASTSIEDWESAATAAQDTLQRGQGT